MMVLGLLAARCTSEMMTGLVSSGTLLRPQRAGTFLSAMADLSSLNERKGAGRVISAPQGLVLSGLYQRISAFSITMSSTGTSP